MLVGGEKFWMSGTGVGGGRGDGDRRVDIESYRGKADFLAAGLVAKLEGNFLGAERGLGLRGERHAENNFVLVHVERSFGEGEGVEFTLRVGDFAGGFGTDRKADSALSWSWGVG